MTSGAAIAAVQLDVTAGAGGTGTTHHVQMATGCASNPSRHRHTATCSLATAGRDNDPAARRAGRSVTSYNRHITTVAC